MKPISPVLELEQQLLDAIDADVTNANDDELFAGGYLRGHISLTAADCEIDGIEDLDVFKQRVQLSIDQAKNELNPADQWLVSQMWTKLLSVIS